jgi:predicted alpha/beta-hydrolase family hydrolase
MNNQPPKKYRDINVSVNGVTLTGTIQSTDPTIGVVTFAHGVSSSRFSPINRYVADRLTDARIASVLVDLLTPGERALSKQRDFRANMELIASRLLCLIRWIQQDEALKAFPRGIFGTNISSAAALSASLAGKDVVAALVLSNARPDLIKDFLPHVNAPTLLIAGDKDRAQLQRNREIVQTLSNMHELRIISGTTHNSHNPKVLEKIADHARQWFVKQFQSEQS